jgi:DNA repair exonuclease SbcCD ATPase subunit
MIDSKELALTSTLTIGALETNAAAIKAVVLEKLKDYTAENYIGKVDEAKRDKAELNAAEKALNAKRLELEREFMRPFLTFKDTINETCKAIKEASGKIDVVVKEVENQEKEKKRAEIQKIWDAQGFTLYSLERVFIDKWLNKTYKIKDIEAEIAAAIKKTFDDLKVIEALPAEDVPLIKTVYLDTLSISDAMSRAQQLKDNRERLAREEKERQQQAINAQLQEQREEEKHQARVDQAAERVEALAAEALEIKQEPVEKLETFALVLTGKRDDLLLVRKYMTTLGVTYIKLQESTEGTWTT